MATNEMNDARRDLHSAQATGAYYLEVFGDTLAAREGYKAHDGMEAICFYLMQKHHWLPATVRAMHPDDLRFAMSEEMHGWTLPAGVPR